MGKLRRLNPTSYWLVGEHESWLSHMASEGYYVVSTNQLFTTFEKRAPSHMQYRIELATSKPLSSEQMELYEQSGWDYVASSKLYHIFASPAERGATEIYTDPTEQAMTVEHLKKKSKQNFIIVSVTMAFMFLLVGGGSLVNDPFFYWFVHGSTMIMLLLICLYALNSFTMFRAYKGLKTLAQQLEQGKPIRHDAPWQRKFTKNRIWQAVFVSFSMLVVFIPFYSIYKMQFETLPDDTSAEPILRLEALDEAYVRAEPELFDGTDYNHHWDQQWNLLAPIMYETNQVGEQEELSIAYYEMRTTWLAKQMLASIIDYESFFRDEEPIGRIEHDVFDELYVYEYEDVSGVLVYARLGKQVIDIQYEGALSTDELIAEAAAFYMQFN